MNWLRIDAATLGHPKVGRLARALGCPQEQALGIVVTLWCAVSSSRPDGCLDGWKAEDIAYICRWSCDPESTLAALLQCGFLDETPTGMVVHEWMEYQGSSEKAKLANAVRQQRFKDRHKESNATVTPDRYPTVTDPLRRTDGRTDGHVRTERTASVTEVTPALPPPPPPPVAALVSDPDTSPVIARFPCSDGSIWEATEQLARTLDEFYPELDIDQEIRDALLAVTADSDRRKRPKEMRSFLTRWLKNSMDDRRNGGKHAQPTA